MRTPIPKPQKKQKKAPKPIKKLGKRGLLKAANRKACLDAYFQTTDRHAIAICQLCGRWMFREEADFAHKHRASQGGPETPANGLALHRLCHTLSHADRDLEDALTRSETSIETGGLVELTPQLNLDLHRALVKALGWA